MGMSVLLAAVVSATVATSAPASQPRLILSATAARPGDELVLRVARAPRTLSGPLRVSLLGTEFGTSGLTASDPRVHRIAMLRPNAGSRARFVVPSLAVGSYRLVYCRCTGKTTQFVRAARAPVLRVETPPEGAQCPSTGPNATAPPGAPQYSFYGNSRLAVLVPADGILRSSEPDGRLFSKLIWIAAPGNATLNVSYRRLDVQAPAIGAVTVFGTLSGYDGPSWASRMYFDRGCWEVRGSVAGADLTVVLKVVAS